MDSLCSLKDRQLSASWPGLGEPAVPLGLQSNPCRNPGSLEGAVGTEISEFKGTVSLFITRGRVKPILTLANMFVKVQHRLLCKVVASGKGDAGPGDWNFSAAASVCEGQQLLLTVLTVCSALQIPHHRSLTPRRAAMGATAAVQTVLWALAFALHYLAVPSRPLCIAHVTSLQD